MSGESSFADIDFSARSQRKRYESEVQATSGANVRFVYEVEQKSLEWDTIRRAMAGEGFSDERITLEVDTDGDGVYDQEVYYSDYYIPKQLVELMSDIKRDGQFDADEAQQLLDMVLPQQRRIVAQER